jgi:Ca2+-binding RTX toxin-like protein
MDTSSAGNKSGQISFSNNDANESPFNFAIAGAVAAVTTGGPAVTASLSNGTLTVNGTATIDTISFALSASGLKVTGNGKTVSGSPFNGVKKIVVNGNDGADRIVVGPGINIPATLNGGNGNDTLIGGDATDLLQGNAGDDNLDGGANNDTLLGGIGNDVLTGGAGLDSMKGEDGDDTLNAADGLADSFVDGGPGNDVVHKDRVDPGNGS